MKNLKLKFIGNTFMTLYLFVCIILGTHMLMDVLLFGAVECRKEEIVGKIWTSLFLSVFFFIAFDGPTWLKRRREIFSRPLEETPDPHS